MASGRFENMISSCTHPPESTPPPIILLAKSTTTWPSSILGSKLPRDTTMWQSGRCILAQESHLRMLLLDPIAQRCNTMKHASDRRGWPVESDAWTVTKYCRTQCRVVRLGSHALPARIREKAAGHHLPWAGRESPSKQSRNMPHSSWQHCEVLSARCDVLFSDSSERREGSSLSGWSSRLWAQRSAC